jgi:uncharacterized membrane protein YsdA (DUF1294 family)
VHLFETYLLKYKTRKEDFTLCVPLIMVIQVVACFIQYRLEDGEKLGEVICQLFV